MKSAKFGIMIMTPNFTYSAMVVYGFLTYTNGEVLIPNKELMDKYNKLLLSKDSLCYQYDIKGEKDCLVKFEG